MSPGYGVVRALAPAKVNPYLSIQARRADGYHEIDTWMLAIDLCDELELRVNDSRTVQLRVVGPAASADISCDEHNLAFRAAKCVLDHAREKYLVDSSTGLELVLTKRIPSQSGLGGASSDAATAYVAAKHLLRLDLHTSHASSCLASLGSDSVFFVAGEKGLARCTGRGEVVSEGCEPPPWHLVLLVPDIGCPTPVVYRWYRQHVLVPVPRLRFPASAWSDPLEQLKPRCVNELTYAARASNPGLEPWFSLLESEFEGLFRLSGSGSAFFGIFGDAAQARACNDRLERSLVAHGLVPRLQTIVRPAGHVAKVL